MSTVDLGTNRQMFKNLSVDQLIQKAMDRGEGHLAANGTLVVRTGKYTGRSPRDKFVVKDSLTETQVAWGKVNQPISEDSYYKLYKKVIAHLNSRELFEFRGYAGAHSGHRIGVRVIAEKAWHALFSHTLFIRPNPSELAHHFADFTILNACQLKALGSEDGVNSEVFIVINFSERVVLIGGTEYAGEIKKSVFTIMNFLLPDHGVFPMHCSANVGRDGKTALFFGLSGTGKTTLSADPNRFLIGDDEHGWGPDGIFNIEGGCYAKCIRLSKESEPQIWNAIKRGSILENVVLNEATQLPDYDDGSLTENTRATYPLEHIPGAVIPSLGAHPSHVFFLTCDAFGVLPPVAKLNPEMAMYHFMSGYTAKVAGTERGITEPQATFSACFGEPFLPRQPLVYAGLLRKYLRDHQTHCWLINTGWSGGPYGEGSRMKIELTRHLLNQAMAGQLHKMDFVPDPMFKFGVPVACPGVESGRLTPKQTWRDPRAYDRKAEHLAKLFHDNFKRYLSADAGIDINIDEIIKAGPHIPA
jgi:phosphoenolpyruvate carboxykinase (ATP)